MTKFLRFSALMISTVALVGCASKDESTVPDIPPPPAHSGTAQSGSYPYDPVTTTDGASSTATTEPLTASGEYTVKAGDSLWKIARGHNTSVAKIMSLNAMTSDVIRPGQVIKLP